MSTSRPPLPLTPTVRFQVRVRPPFRLDLTVGVLRRRPGHPVELWHDGAYVRAFDTARGPAGWRVTATRRGDGLRVALFGAAREPGPWRARVRRALGLDADVSPFLARAEGLPGLAPWAARLEGVRPPRFAALHEALASVIPFQQVSLESGIATLRRLVLALSAPVELAGVVAWPFPPADTIAAAPDATLRTAGLSGAKAAALRGACAAIAAGALREEALEPLPTPALLERLRAIPGIGPWSAAVVALRGFGRLDVFPPGDAAAARGLGEIGGGAALLDVLGPWRGMLYYALFLRRGFDAERHAEGLAERATPP